MKEVEGRFYGRRHTQISARLDRHGLFVRAQRLGCPIDADRHGWFAQDNIFAMDIYRNMPARTARRFESGTPNVPDLYATLAGLKIIEEVGVEQIEKEIQALTGAIKEAAMRRGYALATPVDADKHGPMIAIKAQRVDKLMKWLEEQEGMHHLAARRQSTHLAPFLQRAKRY